MRASAGAVPARPRGVLICSEMAWAGCAWSSAKTCWDLSCTVCSGKALSPVGCAWCSSAARARHCFSCETGCAFLSLVDLSTEPEGLCPKAGGGCVGAWDVCVAVRGAWGRVQCCRAGRASGWRCRGWVIVARARVQGRGVASVSHYMYPYVVTKQGHRGHRSAIGHRDIATCTPVGQVLRENGEAH